MGGLAQEYTEPPEIDFSEDFYHVFGLDGPAFQPKMLHTKWYSLSKLYHPDKNLGFETKYAAIFAKLQFVYDVLSDKIKLKKYIANPKHADFCFPGENAGAQPSGTSPEPAKPVPSLGRLKLYILHFLIFSLTTNALAFGLMTTAARYKPRFETFEKHLTRVTGQKIHV